MNVNIDCSQACVDKVCQWAEDAQVWFDERIAEGMIPINAGSIACSGLKIDKRYNIGFVCEPEFESPTVRKVDEKEDLIAEISFRHPPTR